MIFILLFIIIGYSKLLPLHLRQNTCSRYPYFSIATQYFNDQNYTYTDSLIIGTHKGCFSCCYLEILFKQLKTHINITRIELENNLEFIQNFNVKRFPVLIYRNQTYNDILNFEQILKFISEVQFISITNLQEFESFLQSNSDLFDLKIIGIFYDVKQYREEIQQLTNYKIQSQYRCQIAFMTNKQEIKKLYNKYKTYSNYAYSLYPNNIQFADSIYQIPSFLLIDELRFENSRIYLSTGKPLLLIVLDSITDINSSFQYLVEFQKIAQSFINQQLIYVTWIDGNLNEDRLQMLGIDKFEQIPIITFFDLDDNNQLIFPGDYNNQTQINQFIKDYLSYPRYIVKQKYQKISNKLKSNGLILNSNNQTLIQQVKQISKQYHIPLKILNNNQETLYYVSNQKENPVTFQTLHQYVAVPKVDYEILEKNLIEYYYTIYQ